MMLDTQSLDPADTPPLVAILMCTFNGASFIAEQIESILDQTYPHWYLAVSDDGSTDTTLQQLGEYRAKLGDRLRFYTGPGQGFAANFMSLVANTELTGDYFAFADQDDIWHVDKLAKAVQALELKAVSCLPAIYCGRCKLVDEAGNYLGLSPLFLRKPSFRNAVVQSLAGANTMLLNAKARLLLVGLPADVQVVAHDWLTYLLVTAYGGEVIYDPEPTLDYRQHGRNAIGGNTGLWARSKRLGMLLNGRFSRWSQANLAILDYLKPPLSQQDERVLYWFKRCRASRGPKSVWALCRSGVYRQTWLGQCSLLLGAFLGKI